MAPCVLRSVWVSQDKVQVEPRARRVGDFCAVDVSQWKFRKTDVKPAPLTDMDTPRSSSNGIIAVVCVTLLGLCGYKVYQDHLERERLAKLPPPSTPRPKATPKPVVYSIAVSRLIEPIYFDLFSELNKDDPYDLVPKMTIARERILDKEAEAEQSKKPVYTIAAKLLDGMIPAGEERTEALEVLLKTAAQPRASLETDRTVSSSNQHFFASQLRRVTESLRKRKPALDTLFSQLRNAEREWNTRLPKDAVPEIYDVGNIPSALITVEAQARQNPLEQKAYDQKRAVYPWRRTYYDQYGYPRSY